MKRIFDILTGTWLTPALVFLAVFGFAAVKFNFSLTDHLVNKTIQKWNNEYQPYGPNATQVAPVVQPTTQTQTNSPW